MTTVDASSSSPPSALHSQRTWASHSLQLIAGFHLRHDFRVILLRHARIQLPAVQTVARAFLRPPACPASPSTSPRSRPARSRPARACADNPRNSSMRPVLCRQAVRVHRRMHRPRMNLHQRIIHVHELHQPLIMVQRLPGRTRHASARSRDTPDRRSSRSSPSPAGPPHRPPLVGSIAAGSGPISHFDSRASVLPNPSTAGNSPSASDPAGWAVKMSPRWCRIHSHRSSAVAQS